MNWLLDLIPWWAWVVAAVVALAATYQLWLPLWGRLPSLFKAALITIGAAFIAYIAGRNKGAAGALQRAKDKEQARADDILKRGAEARARSDRDAGDGSLLDDDGWRRKDG
ncbi:hypothetical protein ACO2RV_17195 [Ancylobacter sp. VNQ12]|uniref:hypothetical protein n=1 Tax=Ancylobacter sp. VNQ12 TaxID=3400920 RepID=UPI003C0D1027